MALISWIPPKQPNGQIQHYTLYEREVYNIVKILLFTQYNYMTINILISELNNNYNI